MITIIDYGMGNLGSIQNMLKKVGAAAIISSSIDDIEQADKLILPGVGAFGHGMQQIEQRGLLPVLNEKVLGQKTPILGICLGMQLLTEHSEEGDVEGLGWIKGETVRFRLNGEHPGLKVPHMGWNEVTIHTDNTLFKDVQDEDTGFYFVHSYHVVCAQEEDVLATTHHGYDFVSAVQRGHIMGTQFHPEKSHKYGMRLLKNFAEMA